MLCQNYGSSLAFRVGLLIPLRTWQLRKKPCPVPPAQPCALYHLTAKSYTLPVSTDSEPKKKNGNPDDIPWHPAFFDAIRMELDDYADDLQFISEHPLNTEPLRIDVLIIKKARGVALKKNIAAIFRRDNIVEYKSPTDYVSVRDFHKVCGYARIYAAIEEDADISDMTVTFVESHHPRDLIAHLREACGYAVEEKWPGVYIVSGDLLPIQIIDNRKLSAEGNLWLRGLDNKLGVQEWRRVMTEISRRGKSSRAA